jgi:hypothetical protein
MTKSWQIPRRTFLKGLGTAVALPLLDVMLPDVTAFSDLPGNTAQGLPKRMAFVYVPNGVHMPNWTPRGVGADYELSRTLQPLAPLKQDVLLISGLKHDRANGNGDGGGDHARASATFLTGCQARKSASDIRLGVSVDQVAARAIGDQTRLPSLELSCDSGQESGSCDSGYSCAYQFNISWRSETSPMNPVVEPRSVFDRMFGAGPAGESREARLRRERYNVSVLDFVRDQAQGLQSNLGATDRRKLDEYLTAIRDIERQISAQGRFATAPPIDGVPDITGDYSFERHLRLMYDLMALSFQTDTTRISSLIVSHDGSNRSYPQAGVRDGHHHLSHYQLSDEAKSEKLTLINRYHVTQFAYFLEKLKSIREGDGNLLDNCMILYGAGISFGGGHTHNNLPILLAGRGGRTVGVNRHLRLERETPMSNLYVSMLNHMGVPAERFGDSTGKLEAIG